MKTTLRALIAGLALGLPTYALAEEPQITVVEEQGIISLSSVFGSWNFSVPLYSSGSDSSWGGLNDEDRDFRLFAQHPEGGDLFLSVSYAYGPVPEIWLHLVRPNDATSYGGTSEGMEIEVERYDFFPTEVGFPEAVVAGRFDGDLQDEFGRRANVDGWFEATLPRVAFSIALPDPDPEADEN